MMSNVIPFEKVIREQKDKFSRARSSKDLRWAQECLFALQAFRANRRLQECTEQSVRDSILDVAAIGLSLNPALKHAYLIPRKRRVGGTRENPIYETQCCLDISYLGMKHACEQSGAVRSVRADVVYEADEFAYQSGSDPDITHVPNLTTKDRGVRIAAYVTAILKDGTKHHTVIPAVDVETARACSENSGLDPKDPRSKYSPWVRFTDRMWMKTAVKKGAPYWPNNERLAAMIAVTNKSEGLAPEYLGQKIDMLSTEQTKELRAIFHKTGRPKAWIAAQMKLLARSFGVSVPSKIPAAASDEAKRKAEVGVEAWFKAKKAAEGKT